MSFRKVVSIAVSIVISLVFVSAVMTEAFARAPAGTTRLNHKKQHHHHGSVHHSGQVRH
jgi:hypothetical protein